MLASSLRLHLCSQRFKQVLVADRGHDIVTKVTLQSHVVAKLE